MRRARWCLAAGLTVAAAAEAQQPTVSPAVDRLLARDAVAAVWFFGDVGYALSDITAAVRSVGGRVRRQSRWLHAVSAEASRPAIAAARRRPEFRHLQPVARFRGRLHLPAEPVRAIGPPLVAAAEDSLYGPSAMPFRRLNLFPLVRQGLRGAGVTIALLDTGFETGLSAFAAARVLAQRDFVFDDAVVRNEPNDTAGASRHGTQTWSLLAADLPGQIIGVAPDADYILAKTEDVRSETQVEEDNWVAALEWADSLGADVVSSSLAYLTFDDGTGYTPAQLNGDVAVTTVAADLAAARGIVVVNAVGNRGTAGFRSLVTPADGDSVVAVGAEDSVGVIQPFSSRGPSADGRVKPDLTAPGASVFVVDPDAGFVRTSGTSFSTPLIAGAAALIRQLHPQLGPFEVLEALRRTGSNHAAPDSTQGWGRPDGAAAAVFPRGVVVSSPAAGDTVLASATPRFAWSTPDVPVFAQPVTYRILLSRDAAQAFPLVDSVLSQTEVTLTTPQRPGTRYFLTVRATSADGVTFTTPLLGPFVAPRWAVLTTFDAPEGSATRDVRPTFRWTSPLALEPPGPFTYDLAVIRATDGVVEVDTTGLTGTAYTPPTDLERNTPYRWRVIARLGPDSAVTESRGTFLIIDDSVPAVTLLFQNFPNPFPNPATGKNTTCLWFDLARSGRVRLDILDMRGHVVRNLVPGTGFPSELPAGRYGRPDPATTGRCDPRLEWDGTARDGVTVPRGIYPVRLATPDGTLFKRIVFLGAEF